MRASYHMLLLIGLLAALGCTSGGDYGPTGTIRGKLTMDGKPLKASTNVVFMHPEKGYAAYGSTDAEGNFTISSFNDGNMPIGTYQVMVQAPAADQEPSAEQLLNDPNQSVLSKAEFPFKYRQTSTSGLSYEVKHGENSFEIDLKNEPAPAG